jgi:tyrosinase
MSRIVHSGAIAASTLSPQFVRADIEFHGLDHSGPSYEGRVYLNNPDANESTALALDDGFAGAFHVFGHGGCLGDPGHCEVVPRARFDPRPPHPLTPTRAVVIATVAVGRAVADGGDIIVTVVPVITATNERAGRPDDVVQYESVRIVTYD